MTAPWWVQEGGYPGQVPPPPPGGGPGSGIPPPRGGGTQVWYPRGGGVPRSGTPGGGGGYPGQVPPPGGWGVGVPRSGTPPPPRGGYPGPVPPPRGGGYPGRTTEGVLTTWRAVCLLRSRRRTFLYILCFKNLTKVTEINS